MERTSNTSNKAMKSKMTNRGYTEVNAVQPLHYEHRMKVNDFLRVLQGGEIKSKEFEIFPDVKVYFVIEIISSLQVYIFGKKCKKREAIAGSIEVNIDGNVQTKAFGDPEKNIYLRFHDFYGPYLFPVPVVEADKKPTLEVVWSLYHQQPPSVSQYQEAETPLVSEMIQESLSVVGRAMKEDVTSADLIIKCGNEIFRAHKVVLCSRSPVFKAMIQGHTLEAERGKITVVDIDPDSFGVMLHYVYTGELEVEKDLELQDVLNVADKYDLPGLKQLLFCKMKSEEIKVEFIPDMLILADRFQAGQLKELALKKIRADRKILKDEEFRGKLENIPHILFDIMEQL